MTIIKERQILFLENFIHESCTSIILASLSLFKLFPCPASQIHGLVFYCYCYVCVCICTYKLLTPFSFFSYICCPGLTTWHWQWPPIALHLGVGPCLVLISMSTVLTLGFKKPCCWNFMSIFSLLCLGALSGSRCPGNLNCIISPCPLHFMHFLWVLGGKSFTADISSVGVERRRVPSSLSSCGSLKKGKVLMKLCK